jgi:flagellar export protein FliJ
VDSPSFTFRLERVQALRVRTEDEAREDLARELGHRLRGEAMLREADDQLSGAARNGRAMADRPVGAADLMAAQVWLERLEQRRRDAETELVRLEAVVDERREALQLAQRDREAIDRLERKARAEHDAEWLRKSQADIDEIALNMHRRAHAVA